MRQHDSELLADIRRRTIAALEATIGRDRPVALVGAPNQRNVGDSLIWAGEVEYFRALGLKLRYLSDPRSYSADAVRRALPADGVVLIHGGGNFGDLWPGHQEHREQVARDFPDRKIVQLPQSVWFDSAERAAESAAVLGAHPDFTLLVRDAASRARAEAQLPGVRVAYCWDMAFGWRPPRWAGGAVGRGAAGAADGGSLLVLARADHEAASGLADAPFEVATPLPVTRADWRSTGLAGAAWKAARYVPKLAHRWPAFRGLWFQPALRAGFAAINRINIAEGVRLFSGRRAAVVDRLHAHVLSVLLDLDHVLVDNSYGKLGAVYRDYSGGFSRARYVTSAAEALAFVGELEAGHPHPELAPAGSREA